MRKENVTIITAANTLTTDLHETLVNKFASVGDAFWDPLKVEGVRGYYDIKIVYEPDGDGVRLYAHITDPVGNRETLSAGMDITYYDKSECPGVIADRYFKKSNPCYRRAVYDLADDIIVAIVKADRAALSVSDEYTDSITTIGEEAKIVKHAAKLIRGYAELLTHTDIRDTNNGPLIDAEAKNIEEIIKLTRAALDEIEGCIDYITELADIVQGG